LHTLRANITRLLIFVFILLNAVQLSVPTAVTAQAVPQHLVTMTVHLLKGTKKDFTSNSGQSERDRIVKRAYKILRQEGLFHWGSKSLIKKAFVTKTAVIFGIDPVATADIPKLQKFLESQIGGRTDSAIDELYTTYGRKRLTGQDRQRVADALSSLWDSEFNELAKTYTVEGIRGPHRVVLGWDLENGRFSVQVEDDGNAGAGPSHTRIEGEAQFKVSENGQDLLISAVPTTNPIQTKTAKELATKRNIAPRRILADRSRDQKPETTEKESSQAQRKRKTSPGRIKKVSSKDKRTETQETAKKRKSKIYVWENPKTGEKIKQTRFKRLKEPFEYSGEFTEEEIEKQNEAAKKQKQGAKATEDDRPDPDVKRHKGLETQQKEQPSTIESTTMQQGSRGSIISMEKELYFCDEPVVIRYRVPKKPDYSLVIGRLGSKYRTFWDQLYYDENERKYWFGLEWGGFSDYALDVHSFWPKIPVSTDYIRLIRRERLLPNAIKITGGSRKRYGTEIGIDVDVPREMMLTERGIINKKNARKREFYFDVISVGQSVRGGAVMPEQIIGEQQITQTHTRFELHDYKTRWGGMRGPGYLNPSSGYGIEPGLYELRLQTHDGYIVDRTPLLVTVDEIPGSLKIATPKPPAVGEEIKVVFDGPQPVNSFFYYGIECVRFTKDLASERVYIKGGLKTGEPFFAGRAVQGGHYEIRLFIQNKYMKARYVIDTLALQIGGKPITIKGFFVSFAGRPWGANRRSRLILPQGKKIPVELFLQGKIGLPAQKMIAKLYRKDEKTAPFIQDNFSFSSKKPPNGDLIREWPVKVGRKTAWTIDEDLTPGIYELRISYVFEGSNVPQFAHSIPDLNYSFMIIPFNKFKLSTGDKESFQLGEKIPVFISTPETELAKFLNLSLRLKKYGGRVPGCAIETFEPQHIPLNGRMKHEITPTYGLGVYVIQLVHQQHTNFTLNPQVLSETIFEIVSNPIQNALRISGGTHFSPNDKIRVSVDIPNDHPFRGERQSSIIETSIAVIRHGVVTSGNGIRSAHIIRKKSLDLQTGEATVEMSAFAQGSYEFRLWDRKSGILIASAPFIVRDDRSPFPLEYGLHHFSLRDDLEYLGNPWPALGEYLDADKCQPGPLQVAEKIDLRFVKWQDNEYVPLERPIDFGESFYIEGRLEKPAMQSSYMASIKLPDGSQREVPLFQTEDDPSVIRSELIYFIWDSPEDENNVDSR